MVLCVLSLGVTIAGGLAERQSAGDRPRLYYDMYFREIIKLFWLPTTVLVIILLIMDWKTTLLILIPSWLFGGIVLKPIAEYLVIIPLAFLLSNNKNDTDI